MSDYRLSPEVYEQIEDIHVYSAETWGDAQADEYVEGFFTLFDELASGQAHSRELATELGVKGRISRYRSHYVVWRTGSKGTILIAAIFHRKMDIARRLRGIFDS